MSSPAPAAPPRRGVRCFPRFAKSKAEERAAAAAAEPAALPAPRGGVDSPLAAASSAEVPLRAVRPALRKA
jgi:hypothetical protein